MDAPDFAQKQLISICMTDIKALTQWNKVRFTMEIFCKTKDNAKCNIHIKNPPYITNSPGQVHIRGGLLNLKYTYKISGKDISDVNVSEVCQE